MQIIGWLIIFAFTWNGIKNISEGLWMNLIVDLLCVIITFFTFFDVGNKVLKDKLSKLESGTKIIVGIFIILCGLYFMGRGVIDIFQGEWVAGIVTIVFGALVTFGGFINLA